MFPQSYEFRYRDRHVFSEPEDACPGEVRRDNHNYKVCYYDSEIRPKLINCDLGEGTYQENGSYPLSITGNAMNKQFEFRFTFDPPHIFSSFILRYSCDHASASFTVSFDVPGGPGGFDETGTIVCQGAHQRDHLQFSTIPKTTYQNVTLSITINRNDDGIFLSEVQFFSGTDSSRSLVHLTDYLTHTVNKEVHRHLM